MPTANSSCHICFVSAEEIVPDAEGDGAFQREAILAHHTSGDIDKAIDDPERRLPILELACGAEGPAAGGASRISCRGEVDRS